MPRYDAWGGTDSSDTATGYGTFDGEGFTKDKDAGDFDTRGITEKLKAFNPKNQKGALDYMMEGTKWSAGTKKIISTVARLIPGVAIVDLLSKGIEGEYNAHIEAVRMGMLEQGVPLNQAMTLSKEVVDKTRKDMVTEANEMMAGRPDRDGNANEFLSNMGVDPGSVSPPNSEGVTNQTIADSAPESGQLESTDATAMDSAVQAASDVNTAAPTSSALDSYDTSNIQAAIQGIKDVDTDIMYNHTLAELSGIGMDKNEKALLMAQKEIAMDRALTSIEDTFAPEGDAIVAQQINNLGANALGGTVGQGFVKRWQEREASAKTGALQDIESTYLGVEREAIAQNKQRQLDIWAKQFDADVIGSQLDMEKANSIGGLETTKAQLDLQKAQAIANRDLDIWKTQGAMDLNKAQFSAGIEADKWKTQSGLDFDKWKTTQDFGLDKWKTGELLEDQDLDRLLKEKMGDTEKEAWDEANKWGAIGNIASPIISSWLT